MKTIKLYGHLGKQFGKIHKYHINTPAEAIQLLSANYKGFEKAVLDFKGVGYRVILGKEGADVEDLCNPTGKDVIKIIPVVSGEGGDTGKIILGAALIWAAPHMALGFMNAIGGQMAMSTAGALAVNLGMQAVASFGMAMILGGISGLLYKAPPASISAKQAVSNSFDGAVNTTRQGAPVAVGYGELLIGSAVISAGISTVSVPV